MMEFLRPFVTVKNSLSICAYLRSAAESAERAYGTGWPFWSTTDPSHSGVSTVHFREHHFLPYTPRLGHSNGGLASWLGYTCRNWFVVHRTSSNCHSSSTGFVDDAVQL